MKESVKNVPDIEFLCMDSSENILERFPSTFEKEESFHIITLMFALHYFFKNKATLDGLIKNIDEHLKTGGYFIGACFNGKRLFNTLKSEDTITITKKSNIIFNVEKLYKTTDFTDTETSLGKEISVFMSSIGTTNNEYLVNFDYLDKELKKIGVVRDEIIDFKDIVISNSKLKQLKLNRMSYQEKEISNLNSLFIYKRTITKPPKQLKALTKKRSIKVKSKKSKDKKITKKNKKTKKTKELKKSKKQKNEDAKETTQAKKPNKSKTRTIARKKKGKKESK